MEILIKILQFTASFSLLILVHEFGHFIFARMFGIRVDKFYLFFNPGFSLVKFKYKDTEYGIGWLPFGGYCKIAGMIDESMDTDSMKNPPQRDEFRSRPAWQRLLVMVGGVLMNVLLALGIYTGMCMAYGQTELPNERVVNGSRFNDLAHRIGFQNGDRIVSVDGQAVADYMDIYLTMVADMAPEVEVLRNGEVVTLQIGDRFRPEMNESRDFMAPRERFLIASVDEGGNAQKAGLAAGDRVVAFDSVRMEYMDQISPMLEKNKGRSVLLTVVRDSAGVAVERLFKVAVSAQGTIGVLRSNDIPFSVRHYTLLESFPAGIQRTGSEIAGYWKQLKMIFSPETEAYKSMGGVIAIGSIFPTFWSWEIFWAITAFLSIVLAVMNMLPLPVLDGGHVVFLLYEVVSGRKPSDRFLEQAQMLGLVLLLALVVFANGNDIYRFFIK